MNGPTKADLRAEIATLEAREKLADQQHKRKALAWTQELLTLKGTIVELKIALKKAHEPVDPCTAIDDLPVVAEDKGFAGLIEKLRVEVAGYENHTMAQDYITAIAEELQLRRSHGVHLSRRISDQNQKLNNLREKLNNLREKPAEPDLVTEWKNRYDRLMNVLDRVT